MKCSRLALCTALLLTAGLAHAQERTAAQPTGAQSDITNTALLRKISQQAEVITALQGQLTACRNGDELADAAPQATETFAAPQQLAQTETEGRDEGTEAYSRSRATYHTAPTRRTTGVYQQAAEPKLTCDDYSASYFSRHPAMAAVCGVNQRAPQAAPAADAPEAQPDAHMPIVVPARTPSATQPAVR